MSGGAAGPDRHSTGGFSGSWRWPRGPGARGRPPRRRGCGPGVLPLERCRPELGALLPRPG